MRKERQPRHSPLSAIKDSVDPTQDTLPSELLALCSGQFAPDEDAQLVGASSKTTPNKEQFFDRSLSDGNTQGVRELLGLTAESTDVGRKPTDSIARLFSSFDEGLQSHVSSKARFSDQLSSQSCTQQMNEVIGLCSGVFPTTQAIQVHPPNDFQTSKASLKCSSRVSNAGTSDGMSNHSSDEDEGQGEKERERNGGERCLESSHCHFA